MFDPEGILRKKVIAKIKTGNTRSVVIFTDGTSYKLLNTIIVAFKYRFNSNLVNEQATFFTHDDKNIKYIVIRDAGALDASIPPLP
jgi:hypothetical protein